MDFLPGFKWAVPVAFSDAVAQCRFEEGDMLYDTHKAYDGEWGDASKHIEYSIQVRYPARASGGAGTSERDVFSKNWGSEIRVDLYRNLQKISAGQIETTQGRFYTAIWKGDMTILNLDTDEPRKPVSVQQVTPKLPEASDKAKKLSEKFPIFAMARDLSNPISREKYSKVFSKLKTHIIGDPRLLRPRDAGLSDWAIIAPTIEIAFFLSNGISAEKLHELVKEAVYSPAKGAAQDAFRISAHGVIF
jgi:hypothetical protein